MDERIIPFDDHSVVVMVMVIVWLDQTFPLDGFTNPRTSLSKSCPSQEREREQCGRTDQFRQNGKKKRVNHFRAKCTEGKMNGKCEEGRRWMDEWVNG